MRLTTALLLLLTAFSLGACGGIDGVDVTLPVVGKLSTNAKAKESKMAVRGALVLPPSVKSLPAPVDQSQLAANNANWPKDPEQQAKAAKKLAAIREAEYRKNGDWKNKRSHGNGLDEFNKKVRWIDRQKGILQGSLLKQD